MDNTDLRHHCYAMGYSDEEVGAFYDGYEQGSTKMLDRCINALEGFCEMNNFKGIPKEDIRPLLMELKEQKRF